MIKCCIKKVSSFFLSFTRHCLQTFVSGSNCWSVVEVERKIERDGEPQWVTELNFYMGDLRTEDIDWESDYRFCAVKNKRKQVKMLGVCRTTFPIKYPLWLTNGTIIVDGSYYK